MILYKPEMSKTLQELGRRYAYTHTSQRTGDFVTWNYISVFCYMKICRFWVRTRLIASCQDSTVSNKSTEVMQLKRLFRTESKLFANIHICPVSLSRLFPYVKYAHRLYVPSNGVQRKGNRVFYSTNYVSEKKYYQWFRK